MSELIDREPLLKKWGTDAGAKTIVMETVQSVRSPVRLMI